MIALEPGIGSRLYITHAGIICRPLIDYYAARGWRYVKARWTPKCGLVAFFRAERAI